MGIKGNAIKVKKFIGEKYIEIKEDSSYKDLEQGTSKWKEETKCGS